MELAELLAEVEPEWIKAALESLLPEDTSGLYVSYDRRDHVGGEPQQEATVLAVAPGKLLACKIKAKISVAFQEFTSSADATTISTRKIAGVDLTLNAGHKRHGAEGQTWTTITAVTIRLSEKLDVLDSKEIKLPVQELDYRDRGATSQALGQFWRALMKEID